MEYKPSAKIGQFSAVGQPSLDICKKRPSVNDKNNMNEKSNGVHEKSNFGEEAKPERKKTFGRIDPENDKVGQKLKDVNLAGFSFLARTRSYPGRIFWTLLIAAAIAFLMYELVKTVIDFIGSPIITTYSLKIQDQLDFPKVFVCPAVFINASFYNKNPTRSKEAMAALHTYELISSGNTTLKSSKERYENVFRKLDISSNMTAQPFPNDDNMAASSTMTGSDAYDYLMELGFDEKKLFLECGYYVDDELKVVPCNVTPVIDQRYGKCYEFNVGNNSQKADARGLSLLIDSHAKRYVTDKSLIKNYVGLFVSVNSVYQPAEYENVLVPPGTYTKMALSLEHFVMLNLKSGSLIQPCKETNDKNLTILNVTYSQSGCQMECVLQEVLDKCNCLPLVNRESVFPEILNKTQFCNVTDTELCVKPNIDDKESDDKIQNCQKLCLPPCDSWRYKIRSTSAPLNAPAFKNKTRDAATEELVWLDIAFSRIEYVEFSQDNSMTFDTFVGNAGGHITLWIGGCMMTLLPLPFALISFLIMSCVTRCEKKKVAAEM